MRQTKRIIVAIDGYSACGKSTLAKDIARHFGFVYIDTGAMYRAVTLFALENHIIYNNKINEELLKRAFDSEKIMIEFISPSKKNTSEIRLNGINVDDRIRGIEVSSYVSPIAVIPFVRAALVDQQREIGKGGNIVMDGRDIGTHVFPNADLKIFLTASAKIRAQRRYDELKSKGELVGYEDILNNVIERDRIDSSRETNPLKKAEDAVLIDNSEISIVEQTILGIELVNNVLKKQK
jgi:cytidylate kinase